MELIGDLASENPGGPFLASIPLNCVTRVREFEKGHTKGWEGKFGFVITYRYDRPSPLAFAFAPPLVGVPCLNRVSHSRSNTPVLSLSAAKRAQRFTLVATSEKQQQWWMKAIVMHKGQHYY